MEEIYEKFGSTGFMFCDDTYNDSMIKKFVILTLNQTAVLTSNKIVHQHAFLTN